MTKSFSTFGVAGLALALTASPALANEDRDQTYATVHAGYTILDNWPARVDFGGGIAFDGGLALDGDAEFGIAVGHQYGDWRIEAEYQRGYFGITGVTLDGTAASVDGKGHYDTIMLNAYHDFDLTDTLSAFVGAGAGWSNLSLPKVVFDPSCNCFGETSKRGFSYQLRAGVEYDVTDRLSFYGQYNRLFLPATNGSGAPSTSYAKKNFGIASVGLRLAFGSSGASSAAAAPTASLAASAPVPVAEAAVAVEAPVAAAPAPAPISQTSFIVYFDLENANIDDAAKLVLDQAIKTYTDNGMAAVKLVGSADRSGSVAYNQALSERRVQAVAAYLAANGVPQNALTSNATGETAPRVPTADGVAERENRTVELTIGK